MSEVLVFLHVPSSVVTKNLTLSAGTQVHLYYMPWAHEKVVMKRIDETYLLFERVVTSRGGSGKSTTATLIGPVSGWEDVTADDHRVFKMEIALEGGSRR